MTLAATVVHPPEPADETRDEADADCAEHPGQREAVLVLLGTPPVVVILFLELADACAARIQVALQTCRLCFERLDRCCRLRKRTLRFLEFDPESLCLRLS